MLFTTAQSASCRISFSFNRLQKSCSDRRRRVFTASWIRSDGAGKRLSALKPVDSGDSWLSQTSRRRRCRRGVSRDLEDVSAQPHCRLWGICWSDPYRPDGLKLKMLGLPLPAALGLFSTTGDFSVGGDTQAIYTVTGVAGRLNPPRRDRQFLADMSDRQIQEIPSFLHSVPT